MSQSLWIVKSVEESSIHEIARFQIERKEEAATSSGQSIADIFVERFNNLTSEVFLHIERDQKAGRQSPNGQSARIFIEAANALATQFVDDGERADAASMLEEFYKNYFKLRDIFTKNNEIDQICTVTMDEKGRYDSIAFDGSSGNLTEAQRGCLGEISIAWAIVAKLLGSRNPTSDITRGQIHHDIARLRTIAQTVWKDESARAASDALTLFKFEVKHREADFVKNRYADKLAKYAIGGTAIFLCLWYLSLEGAGLATFDLDFLFKVSPYFLAAAGACLGAFLSFVIRTPSLSFENLSSPEPDLLKPIYRLLYVVVLTFFLGWFLDTGLATMQFGDTTLGLSPETSAMSFLIGGLCGIAERTIATAIAARADGLATAFSKT